MRRALNFLVRNWPLKVGAIVLATVLYSGLVLAQNVRTWSGQVPVDFIRPPAGASLISELQPVRMIRYRAPLDVGVLGPDSFSATIDLSRVQAQAGGPPVPVPITLIALNPGVQIVDFEPREEQVQLDPVQERDLPVKVVYGTVPDSISIGPAQVDPQSVTVRGASSRVASVATVQARVSIDASALNIDRDVDLVAVDSNSNQVPNVVIEPPRVRIRIAVAQELATRSLPIVPILTGAPAPGYRISSVSVDPLVVTVSGEAATVSQLQNAPTSPIDVTGRTTDLDAEVGLNMPTGVSITGTDRVRVRITVTQDTGSQTYALGVVLTGEQPGFTYSLSNPQVNVTLGGPTTALATLDPASLAVTADVTGANEGSRIVRVAFTPPTGLTLIGIDPPDVAVIISPPPSPSPSLIPST